MMTENLIGFLVLRPPACSLEFRTGVRAGLRRAYPGMQTRLTRAYPDQLKSISHASATLFLTRWRARFVQCPTRSSSGQHPLEIIVQEFRHRTRLLCP